MKLRQLLLPTGLAVAVLTSISLSGLLWTNPAHSNLTRSTKTAATNDNATNASFKEVNLPTQIVYTDEDGEQSLLSNNETNVAAAFQRRLSDFTSGRVTNVGRRDTKSYFKQLNRKNSVTLNFGSAMNTQYFQTVFNPEFRIEDRAFNRVQLPTNDADHVYLLNDATKLVSQVSVRNHNLKKINAILQEPMVSTKVEFHNWHGQPMLYYPRPMTMKVYSYQATQQTQSYYANRIMTTNTNSNMQVKRGKHKTTYDDRGFRHMVVDQTNGTVTFTNYDSRTGTGNFLTMMQRAYNEMVMVGVPLDNVRLYSYDANQKEITFRTFVEGLPVFNQTGFGAVRTKLLSQDSYQMNFSLSSVQVPIAPEKATAEVMSTPALLGKLKALGIAEENIDNVQLGYHWAWDVDLDKVVNLTPTWYVLIDNHWQSYDELVAGAQVE